MCGPTFDMSLEISSAILANSDHPGRETSVRSGHRRAVWCISVTTEDLTSCGVDTEQQPMLVWYTCVLVDHHPVEWPVGASARDRERPGKMPILRTVTTEGSAPCLFSAQCRLSRVDRRRWWRRAELGRLLPAFRLLRHDLASQPLDDDAEKRRAGRSPRRIPGRDEGVSQPARSWDC